MLFQYPERRSSVSPSAQLRPRHFEIFHRAPIALQRSDLDVSLGDIFRDVLGYLFRTLDDANIHDRRAHQLIHLRRQPFLRNETTALHDMQMWLALLCQLEYRKEFKPVSFAKRKETTADCPPRLYQLCRALFWR